MLKFALALASGLVFGSGILLSGMANPAKILNFFDFFGSWDASLAFVMAGALAVTAVGYRLVWHRAGPLAGGKFMLPAAQKIDRRLILGSAIFGIGWGISGFCPGGAIPGLGLGRWEVAAFVTAMVLGLVLARTVDGRVARGRKLQPGGDAAQA